MTKAEFDTMLQHLEAAIDESMAVHPVQGKVWHGIRGLVFNPTVTASLEAKLVTAGILTTGTTTAAPAATAAPASTAAPAATHS